MRGTYPSSRRKLAQNAVSMIAAIASVSGSDANCWLPRAWASFKCRAKCECMRGASACAAGYACPDNIGRFIVVARRGGDGLRAGIAEEVCRKFRRKVKQPTRRQESKLLIQNSFSLSLGLRRGVRVSVQRLSLVVYQDVPGVWVGRGIEHDLTAEGRSIGETVRALLRMIQAHTAFDARHD